MPSRDQTELPGEPFFEQQQPVGLFRNGGTKEIGGRCQETEALLQGHEKLVRIEVFDSTWKEATMGGFFSLCSWKK